MKQRVFEYAEAPENLEEFAPQEPLEGADLHFYPLDEWGDRSYAARSQDRLSDGLTFETMRRIRAGGLIIISLDGGRPGAGRSAVAAARVRSVQRLPNGRYFASVRFDFETHLAGNIDAFQQTR